MVQFLSINFFSWISSIFVGFFKSSRSFVSSCITHFPFSEERGNKKYRRRYIADRSKHIWRATVGPLFSVTSLGEQWLTNFGEQSTTCLMAALGWRQGRSACWVLEYGVTGHSAPHRAASCEEQQLFSPVIWRQFIVRRRISTNRRHIQNNTFICNASCKITRTQTGHTANPAI